MNNVFIVYQVEQSQWIHGGGFECAGGTSTIDDVRVLNVLYDCLLCVLNVYFVLFVRFNESDSWPTELMTFYRLISASDGNLFVCLCTMTQSDQKLPTGRRVLYGPTGYKYDVYNLCPLATVITELLCALSNDNHETTMSVWQQRLFVMNALIWWTS